MTWSDLVFVIIYCKIFSKPKENKYDLNLKTRYLVDIECS